MPCSFVDGLFVPCPGLAGAMRAVRALGIGLQLRVVVCPYCRESLCRWFYGPTSCVPYKCSACGNFDLLTIDSAEDLRGLPEPLVCTSCGKETYPCWTGMEPKIPPEKAVGLTLMEMRN